MARTNRVIWIFIFLGGFFYFALLEWGDEKNRALGWFLLTGLWSAFCGIGYTVFDWFIRFRKE